MKNTDLDKLINLPNLPKSIKYKINNILEEDEAYVADELVELSEEILFQLASTGMSIYIGQPKQKDVFNDFIIDLFTTKSHVYNAGPLFRWVAHMIKDLEEKNISLIKRFFWTSNDQGELILNPGLQRLSELRNAVMHGFFVLPAQRNREEANHLADILKLLVDNNIFGISPNFECHFLEKENELYSFCGDWTISPAAWFEYTNCYSFGKLSTKIQYESSDQYEIDQKLIVEKDKRDKQIPTKLLDDFIDNNKGALAYWVRPNQNLISDYSIICDYLSNKNQTFVIYQSLEELGINYTSGFLLNRVVKYLSEKTGANNHSKNSKKALSQLSKKCDFKIVVVINNIHIGMFNNSHITSLFNLFYDNNIQVISLGYYHPYMDRFFNSFIEVFDKAYHPKKNEWDKVLSNYLRFKGPSSLVEEQKGDYDLILKITESAISELKKGSITARRFADKNKFPIEFVHEVFDVLSPFYKIENDSFKIDLIDDLYDFPKEITESSRTIFSIGRRDTKLEYQHKILSV